MRHTLQVPPGMQAVALDMLEVMVRSSSPPLGEPLINVAFPAVVQRTLNTDDNSTLQNGGECLRAYISVAPDQVMLLILFLKNFIICIIFEISNCHATECYDLGYFFFRC